MPQSDRVPLGLVQVQPLRTCLIQEKIGPAPTVKTEASPQVAAIPHAMATPKQVAEKCSWGPHCPICKNEEEHEEDWDDDRQKEPPRMYPQNNQHPQSQNIQHPHHKTLSTPSHLMYLTNTLNKSD